MAYCQICGVLISLKWGARPVCPTCAEAEKAAEKAAEPEPDGEA